MTVRLGVALLGAIAVALATGIAVWLVVRAPAGVEFSRRVDGIEQVEIPTDRGFSVARGGYTMTWGGGSAGFPDPTPRTGSEALDPQNPIFPPHYVRDYEPPGWRTPATLAPCALKDLPSDIWVKPIVVYEGKLVATTRIATPDHDYTSRIDVTVANTGLPVVLLLSSYRPVQWRIGQTSRAKLAGVVVVGFKRAEVVGLPNAVPVLMAGLTDTPNCGVGGVFYIGGPQWEGLDEPDHSQPVAEALAQRLFHASALSVAYEYDGSLIVVGDKSDVLGDVRPFYSNDRGDVFKRPSDLLLPGELGLEQLRTTGAVRRATIPEVDAWNAAEKAGLGRANFGHPNRPYVLLRETELPDGLDAVDFLLPESVPMPHGWHSGSRVCVQKLWKCSLSPYGLRPDAGLTK
jgi:hypothetical protein